MDRILFVTRNFPPAHGGIETMAWQVLVRALESRKERFIVLHFGQEKNHGLPEKLYRYHHFPAGGVMSTFFFSSWLVPLFALLYRPRLIINMQVTTGLGSCLYGWMFRVPYFVIGLGLELMPSDNLPFNLIRKIILTGARKVLSISNFTDSLAAEYGVAPERRKILTPGADPERFKPLSHHRAKLCDGRVTGDDFLCLSVSRLIPRKGIDTVISAVAEIIKSEKNLKYIIAGSGPDTRRLKNLVKEKDLMNHVFFLGRQTEDKLPYLYSAADLFVLPCRSTKKPPEVEGFGLVFLEAGACGTPSVGSRSGGIPDAVKDGETGFLIEPDDTAAVIEKILVLKHDPSLLAEMGSRARRRVVDELNWQKVAGRYLSEIFMDDDNGQK
ncbi:glycosyltransferase family 4 protein [Fibrobacterota bacterium]